MTTPSTPQGQNPYGQQPAGPPQGNPYGQQQPYGQNPYGQQPAGGFPGGAPVPPAPPAQGGGKKKAIGGIVGGVVVLALAIGGWIAGQDDADQAEAGDCVVNNGTSFKPDVEVVECGTAKAEFEVVEKHDGEGTCDRTKYAEYTETKGSDTLFTLCLKPVSGSGS
ncbi:hypothetical protein [Streptomyces sp. JJ36]|uniref:LppU/SCO3897 family protein n=1 Tax=Streptomyces sp. JJ36 TaxID=2736645 RepID=UPI001F209EF1|nr:hypothetical protein [Streptomyces sp. JJ36]MCF6522196.1 hypothetical protein [Streptomyces sp. JJ36]